MFEKSQQLFQRATQVIPGGIYGHMSPAAALPLRLPYYASKAQGCRYWDVDGNQYIDFLGGYGPMVLGYNHPEIEEAAEHQRVDGDCFNHPTEAMVELAELLVEKVDFSNWCVFGKNGSDMTNWAIQVAREQTKRKKILKVHGAYHGTGPWCTPGHGGLIDTDRQHIVEFEWNNLDSFHHAISSYRDDIAGVIITPYHHPAFGASILPADGFLAAIENSCRDNGFVFILDDIRAGFRLHMGGSHRYFDFTPDIICFSKALGNGYPISAALGNQELKIAASKVFLTGSYWNSAVPMKAALKCLEVLERDKGIEKMAAMGSQLCRGLESRADKFDLNITCSGPAALPFLSFGGNQSQLKMQRFSEIAAQHGAFFHPHHNWFMSTVHENSDIEEALNAADKGFKIVAEEFGGKKTE